MRHVFLPAFLLLAMVVAAPVAQAQPCATNDDCPPGFYCAKPPGLCSGPGVCTQIPEGCGGDFNPVCGCDGVTYSNACVAAANGVNVASAGECGTITLCSEFTVCPTGFYCMTEPGNCGGTGLCVPIPGGACPAIFDPVCGCDGMTYGNPCFAALAGVSIASEGECPGGTPCTSNADCAAPGFFCMKAVGDCDGPGICVARPDACPLVFAPVCGCDGQTYSNACFANAAGVSVASNTPCCPGDFDGDGNVGFVDLNIMLAAWGPCPVPFPIGGCVADLDGDGNVGFADLSALLENWGPCDDPAA